LREEEFEKKVRRSREGVRIGEMRGAKKNRGRRLQTWKVRLWFGNRVLGWTSSSIRV